VRFQRFGRSLFALSFVACLATSNVARAQDDAEALIAKGVELREKGKDEEALALFKKAYAKSPSPRARAQVALAEQALGMWVAAETDLVAALGSESDPWIAKNRAALDGALGVIRRHIGSLEVRGADGAEVLVDGAPVGVASPGASFRVEAGRRTLEVRSKGHHATTRAVEVPAGGVARETVSLVAMSNADGSGGGNSNSSGGSGGNMRAGEDDPGRGQRVLGWAFIGVGGALLATGAAGLLIRKGIVDDYNVNCPGLGAAQPANCEDKVESARTWNTVSIVSLIAGGVFAIGGVALMVTAPSGPAKSASFRTIHCSFDGCAGTF
jgi:hypothetical protein